MGLFLAGHLSCLSATDLYRYLSQEHEATTIGVLLGMAAAKRCSADAAISKMLFLHVPTRHPPTYPELELSPHVQAAAILGAGLLYMGSCHRCLPHFIWRSVSAQQSEQGMARHATWPFAAWRFRILRYFRACSCGSLVALLSDPGAWHV